MNWKILKDIVEKNVRKTNWEIMSIAKKEYPEEFDHVWEDTLRKRIGEARKLYGLFRPVDAKYVNPKATLKIKDTDVEIDKDSWLKTEGEVTKLREKLKHSENKNKTLMAELEASNGIIEAMTEIEEREPEPVVIGSRKFSTKNEGTAFLLLSDTHIEENVDPSTVNFLNEYNPGIAKDSFVNFFRKGVNLCEIFGRDIQIKNIVLAILGDIISGHIHEELLEDNHLSPTQATMLASDLIGSGIEHILKHTKCELTIPCKIGNHGRTTAKRRVSTEHKNSFEWMMFQQLKKEFKREDRVNFVIDNSYLTYLDVYDRPIRLHHGHNLKYWGGVGGITIPVAKAIAQWDKQRKAYLDVFGHFHTAMLDTGVAGKFVSNGSMVGYNAFACSIKASYEPPQQGFFIIDKLRGKTTTAPIFVRKDR